MRKKAFEPEMTMRLVLDWHEKLDEQKIPPKKLNEAMKLLSEGCKSHGMTLYRRDISAYMRPSVRG